MRGAVLEPSSLDRGVKSSRKEIESFELRGQAVILASGGIGGDFELVREHWPARLGTPPRFMVQGVPDYVDGRMLTIAEAAGARLINRDRMWHYTEGLRNWNPIWTNHGIRILPGPTSLWLDATGKRLPPPLFPGFDNLGTLDYIMKTGYEYSWFVLNHQIIKKEFALSGSEQNPDFTNKDWRRSSPGREPGRDPSGRGIQGARGRLRRRRHRGRARQTDERKDRARPARSRGRRP